MFIYTKAMLKACLLNWPDLEQVESDFRLIDMRCDIELALSQAQSDTISRKDVATILNEGVATTTNPDGVDERVVEDLVDLLYIALSVEGLY